MSTAANILLVDDEPRFVNSLQSILTHYGYNCTTVYNGSQALEELRNNYFALALLDVELPDMSGCDIAAFIKRSCQQTTSIMLTGINTVETAVQAMKMGAYDFLSKPLDHGQLLRTLEKALEHNRLQRELVSSEEKFKVLAEAAWEGIAVHDQDTILEMNRPFQEMFALSQVTDVHISQLILPDKNDSAEAVAGEQSLLARRLRGRKSDGTIFPIEANSRSITYQGRKHQVLVVRDLTEHVRAEEEKLQLQKKLASANKLNALGLMAGAVAHDLNNILTGIVSYPDILLQQMDESDKHYDHIVKMQSAGKRAAAVVSDLVAITRGKVQQKSAEDINELVFNYLNSIEHGERQVQYPGIRVETRLHRNVSNVNCSAPHIHKLMLNLIGNGLEAVGKEGCITVSTENCLFVHPVSSRRVAEEETEYVKLTVSDNGPGIDPKDIENIFNPFYSTKVMGKSGTGLGLSVVWNIVQDHDGWIEVKNNNPGARFEIYLPATKEQTTTAEATPILSNALQGKGERILIVDDQVEQNEILERALSTLGYSAKSVTSGEEAIDYLQSNEVDLLLMDMIMGEGMNGRETLEVIFKDHPEQKAIIVSGYAKKEELDKTRELGVSLFLEKPVTISTVGKAVRSSLSN